MAGSRQFLLQCVDLLAIAVFHPSQRRQIAKGQQGAPIGRSADMRLEIALPGSGRQVRAGWSRQCQAYGQGIMADLGVAGNRPIAGAPQEVRLNHDREIVPKTQIAGAETIVGVEIGNRLRNLIEQLRHVCPRSEVASPAESNDCRHKRASPVPSETPLLKLAMRSA